MSFVRAMLAVLNVVPIDKTVLSKKIMCMFNFLGMRA